MILRTDRRRFLKALAIGSALVASPALARNSWDIRGSDKGSLNLAFFTDVHARDNPSIIEAMQKAADTINLQTPDIVLGGGDFIDRGFVSPKHKAEAGWDAYMEMHRAIDGEVHCAMGNHDLVGVVPNDGSMPEQDSRAVFTERLGLERTYYALDAVGYRIVVLDAIELTGDADIYRGWVSDEQLDWLRQTLAHTPNTLPIILMLHMPLVTAFFGATEGATNPAQANRVVVNNVEVLQLFAEHNLVLVLQGHSHIAELIHWRGTTFITGGAICANWWRGAYHGTQEGFNILTLHEGHVEWDYVDYGWDAPGG